MIRTLDIPRERWRAFVQDFSRLWEERPIRVEVIGRELGDQELDQRLPLVDIDLDGAGSEAGSVTITVGGEQGQLTHRVLSPARIYLGLGDQGAEWLAIEEEGGRLTMIHVEPHSLLEEAFPCR